MTNTNIRLYNDTLRALKSLESGMIIFNNRFTEFNKKELEDYLKRLDDASFEFRLNYRGPEVYRLELLERVAEARDEAFLAIHEFNELSSI